MFVIYKDGHLLVQSGVFATLKEAEKWIDFYVITSDPSEYTVHELALNKNTSWFASDPSTAGAIIDPQTFKKRRGIATKVKTA